MRSIAQSGLCGPIEELSWAGKYCGAKTIRIKEFMEHGEERIAGPKWVVRDERNLWGQTPCGAKWGRPDARALLLINDRRWYLGQSTVNSLMDAH